MDFFYYYSEVSDASEAKIVADFANYAMPEWTDAAGRYDLLKNYTAMLQFTWSKFKYQVRAIDKDGIPGETDIANINKAIAELNVFRNHKDLSNPKRRSELLKEARLRTKKDTFGEVKDEQHLILLIYLLHEENWFNEFPLSEEAFEFYAYDNRLDMIGEVYGKYFLFYDYLQSKLKDRQQQLIMQPLQPMSDSNEESEGTFKSMFFVANRTNGIYDSVIEALSKPLPDYFVRDCKKDCKIPDDFQFVYFEDGRMTWNNSIHGSQSYLAGLYQYCRDRPSYPWIKQAKEKQYLSSAMNSFHIDMSRNAFADMMQGNLNPKFLKPFKLLFRDM
jgi:hypothetical protein